MPYFIAYEDVEELVSRVISIYHNPTDAPDVPEFIVEQIPVYGNNSLIAVLKVEVAAQ